MAEAHAARRQSVVLEAFSALEGRFTASVHLQVNFKPANALLVPQVAHEQYFVNGISLEDMLCKPSAIRRVKAIGCHELVFVFFRSSIARASDQLSLLVGHQTPTDFALVEDCLGQKLVDTVAENVADELV